ncbi:RING-type E3 ubiquitin-protein ligase PPIL2 isoform X3 [Lepidochelys kempii]|uniref:RING-type E3 ubiquitin-protein ligase PPIL2 isoform X3 n=1 Tax=Lepidochelys kempii TaxID=8472 RepID=UPI003C6F928D
MGKRQHQKDKMYITCAEYTHFYGGKKSDIPQANFRRLSFDHCSLSLQPFEYPVCTPDGTVFDLLSIVPWIKKFGTNPITGEKLDAKSLVKLNFAKNNEGNYHCPVLFTVFTNNSHIVAIKTTGNVFAYEAVEQLNIKTKSYKDLLTDEPFTRQDILTLQDPTNLDKFNVSDFFHVKNNLKVTDPDEEKAKLDPSYYLKNTNLETRETLLELYKEFKGDDILAATMKAPEKRKVDKLNAAHYSTGTVSASFTSTAMAPETTHEAAAIEEDVVRYQYVKKKGYVRLHTNKGDLNLELHCDMTPRACENFIKLCKKNYYDGTVFHRSIRNFVIQGGDPTGTGTGVIWDESENVRSVINNVEMTARQRDLPSRRPLFYLLLLKRNKSRMARSPADANLHSSLDFSGATSVYSSQGSGPECLNYCVNLDEVYPLTLSQEESPIGENLLKMSSSQICPTLDVVLLAWPIQDPTATNHNSLSHFAPAHTWTRSTPFLEEWLVVLRL